MTAVFQNINDSEFSLNGIKYDKVFLALPRGNDSIMVVGIYDNCNRILDPTKIEDITVNGNAYNSVASLVAALKPVLYNYNSGGGGGTPGTEYIGKRLYTLNLSGINTNQEERKYIADAINRGDVIVSDPGAPYFSAPGQEMLFQTVIPVFSSGTGLSQQYVLQIKTYGMLQMINEVGGTSGITISKDDIYADGQENVIIPGAGSSVVTHFGEIGNTPIEDKVNEGKNSGADPYDIEGFHIFDALRDGELHIYMFVGVPGQYGGNNMGTGGIMEAFAEDFQDITEQPPVAPDTQIFLTYNDISEMLADTANQSGNVIMYVKNAEDDANLSFDQSETRRQAFYRASSFSIPQVVANYTLISSPYGASKTPTLQEVLEKGNVATEDIEIELDSGRTGKFIAKIGTEVIQIGPDLFFHNVFFRIIRKTLLNEEIIADMGMDGISVTSNTGLIGETISAQMHGDGIRLIFTKADNTFKDHLIVYPNIFDIGRYRSYLPLSVNGKLANEFGEISLPHYETLRIPLTALGGDAQIGEFFGHIFFEDAEIVDFRVIAGERPQGSSIDVDLKINDDVKVTRKVYPPGMNHSSPFSIISATAGDKLRLDVTSVGGISPGKDLVAIIRIRTEDTVDIYHID